MKIVDFILHKLQPQEKRQSYNNANRFLTETEKD